MRRSQKNSANKSGTHVTVHVKLSDFLTRLAAEAEFDLQIAAGATVAEIIAALTARQGDNFRRAVTDRQGNLHAGYAVVLDKQLISPQQFAKTTIHHPCSLSIIPLAGGG
ncbi:MAG: MoaD/ThiS family protein [Desulfobacterales bacterium]|nr:MAG: MoaD/ThiS family protein [Desulfobacterales bacterium]